MMSAGAREFWILDICSPACLDNMCLGMSSSYPQEHHQSQSKCSHGLES